MSNQPPLSAAARRGGWVVLLKDGITGSEEITSFYGGPAWFDDLDDARREAAAVMELLYADIAGGSMPDKIGRWFLAVPIDELAAGHGFALGYRVSIRPWMLSGSPGTGTAPDDDDPLVGDEDLPH